jgi:hypothetical protein
MISATPNALVPAEAQPPNRSCDVVDSINPETQDIVGSVLGGHVKVEGREMTVTISGHCASITVDGVINKVSVDSADTVDIGGIHNVVTYHSGSPNVTKNGLNTVSQG